MPAPRFSKTGLDFLTTLGANTFSMGVLGSFAGIAAFMVVRRLRFNLFWAGFVAGVLPEGASILLDGRPVEFERTEEAIRLPLRPGNGWCA